MKKGQAVKFWKELSNSTSTKEVISAFANKRGYGGKRTLVRYSQAAAGFKEDLACNVIAGKTGWSADYIDKIHAWWEEAFPSEVGPVTQELATRVAPARTEHEVPKEARTEQESYKETPHKQKMRELAGKVARAVSLHLVFCSVIEERIPGHWFIDDGLSVNISETGNVEVDLDVELDFEGHLYEGLFSHIQTGGFADVLAKIADWKREAANTLVESHNLLTMIKKDIEERCKVTLSLDYLDQTGFTLDFLKTLFWSAVNGLREVSASLYRIDGCNLSAGPTLIYSGSPDKDLKRYRDTHIELRKKYFKNDLAKQIRKQMDNIRKTGRDIRRQLEKFRDMERLPGQCELCNRQG